MIVMTRQSSSFVWKAYASDTMKGLWTFSRILFSTIAPYRRIQEQRKIHSQERKLRELFTLMRMCDLGKFKGEM